MDFLFSQRMKDNYAILINTTDSFDDCWEPFFKLFKKHWPEFNGKIYLNTETKEFKYSGINIISIKNGLDFIASSREFK